MRPLSAPGTALVAAGQKTAEAKLAADGAAAAGNPPARRLRIRSPRQGQNTALAAAPQQQPPLRPLGTVVLLVKMGNANLTIAASSSISIQMAKKYRSRRLRRSRHRRRRKARELPLLVKGRVDHRVKRRLSKEKRRLASSMVPMPDVRKATAVSSRVDKYASSKAMQAIQNDQTPFR